MLWLHLAPGSVLALSNVFFSGLFLLPFTFQGFYTSHRACTVTGKDGLLYQGGRFEMDVGSSKSKSIA